MGGKNKRGAHADTKTVMNKDYIDTVRLLLEAAPAVFHGSTFAMKGGTAINLFACAMPRLSVDIDAVFINHTLHRGEALSAISAALQEIGERLMARGLNVELRGGSKGGETKLFVRRREVVKIEVNHVFRGCILPPAGRRLVSYARDLFKTDMELPTLAVAELYGSKLVAAMDRQHPRDLFDVHGLYAGDGLAKEVVDCFVCYLAGHNRPVHEVLFARPLDIAAAFTNEFAGMAREPVALDELLAVRERLRAELPVALSPEHRRFLVSLVEADPDWTAAPCPHLSEMPAIQWKLQNLRKLRSSNPRKFADQSQELKERLGL
jgi:predicted nucleotidyltransferase component of viral defense system